MQMQTANPFLFHNILWIYLSLHDLSCHSVHILFLLGDTAKYLACIFPSVSIYWIHTAEYSFCIRLFILPLSMINSSVICFEIFQNIYLLCFIFYYIIVHTWHCHWTSKKLVSQAFYWVIESLCLLDLWPCVSNVKMGTLNVPTNSGSFCLKMHTITLPGFYTL